MRKLMKPLLLSVGLVVCPALAICQQPVPATLSLSDAIALAREHNPAYRQTIHDRSPAAWGVRNAWSSLWLPSVTASGGVGYAGPGEQNFLTSSFSQGVSTVLELQLSARLDTERADAQPTRTQEGAAERGGPGRARGRNGPRDRGDPAVPDGAAGAGQRRSGATAARSRRAVPEAGAGALRRRSRVAHRRAAGAGGARCGRGGAAARAHGGPRREAAAVPADRRVGARGARDGTAHRHL